MTGLDVLTQLGTFGIGVATLGWLARTIFVHWLGKDVEQYRSKLQNAHDVEMEKLRNDLRLRSIEHEIRFRSIHERQAEALSGTYSRLYSLHRAVSSYVHFLDWSNGPSKEEKLKAVADTHEEFRSFFFPQKIFFPRSTGERVKSMADKCAEIANVFTRGQRREQMATRSPQQDDGDYWDKAYEMMKDEVPPLLEQLERDFQRLLGVGDIREQNGKRRENETEQ